MRYVHLDTETTSLIEPWRKDGRKVWEFAATVVEAGKVTVETEFFLEADLTYADPFALNVGKFWDRYRHEYAMEGYEAAARIHKIINGATIFGFNPRFDMVSIDHLLHENGFPTGSYRYDLHDLKASLRGYLRGIGLVPVADLMTMATDDLAAAAGIEIPTAEQRHTAAGDVMFSRRVAQFLFPDIGL